MTGKAPAVTVSPGKAGSPGGDSIGRSGPAGAATRPAALHTVRLTFSPRPQRGLHAPRRAHRVKSAPFWRICTEPTAIAGKEGAVQVGGGGAPCSHSALSFSNTQLGRCPQRVPTRQLCPLGDPEQRVGTVLVITTGERGMCPSHVLVPAPQDAAKHLTTQPPGPQPRMRYCQWGDRSLVYAGEEGH